MFWGYLERSRSHIGPFSGRVESGDSVPLAGDISTEHNNNTLLRIQRILVASIAYLQYRARKTLDIVSNRSLLVAYQIIIIIFEVVSDIFLFVHTLKKWKVVGKTVPTAGVTLKKRYPRPSHTPDKKD